MARTNIKRNHPMSLHNEQQQQDNQQHQVEEKTKRLVIVTGDKGGVGKSTFSRGLLQLYIDRNLFCIAYDADQRNNQLRRHHEKFNPGLVRCINVFDRGKADQLLIDLEAETFPLVLLDLPAQSGGVFELFVKELSFFDTLADELGYRVTMVSIINRLRDSVNILNALHKYCENKVDYVVVKNLFFGDKEKFGRYDGSPIRETLLGKGLVEVLMPDLIDYCYDFIDENDLTFRQASSKDFGSLLAVRARVKSWLDDFEEKLKPAPNLLGFNCEQLPEGFSHTVKEDKSEKATVDDKAQNAA